MSSESPAYHPPRQHPRAQRLRPVVVSVAAPARGTIYGRLETVGPGGAMVRCPQALPPGTELEVEICLAGGVIQAHSRVLYDRWDDGAHAVGLEFLDLAGPSRLLLQRLLAEES